MGELLAIAFLLMGYFVGSFNYLKGTMHIFYFYMWMKHIKVGFHSRSYTIRFVWRGCVIDKMQSDLLFYA